MPQVKLDFKYSLNGKPIQILSESVFDGACDVKFKDGTVAYNVSPDELRPICSKCGGEC
mgnify:CR=1 FL=1